MSFNEFLPRNRYWRGRKVFVTGHTGFKGSWLCLWLARLGAQVKGYSLAPNSQPSIAEALRLSERFQSVTGDILDRQHLSQQLLEFGPELVFHLAAQPLVLESFHEPALTFATNAMGTVNLLETCRAVSSVKAIVVITTDKVYKNEERQTSYREDDPLGGKDPYSASKACAEIITSAYENSFFRKANVAVATARAGNVFGGGDWSQNRLIPDAIRAFVAKEPLLIRNPQSVRPWQFVLEPLCGYLMLAAACLTGVAFSGAYNFGPDEGEIFSVAQLATAAADVWGESASWLNANGDHVAPKEAGTLILNSGHARRILGWRPVLSLKQAMQMTIDWYRCYYERGSADLNFLTEQQIDLITTMYLEGERLCGVT